MAAQAQRQWMYGIVKHGRLQQVDATVEGGVLKATVQDDLLPQPRKLDDPVPISPNDVGRLDDYTVVASTTGPEGEKLFRFTKATAVSESRLSPVAAAEQLIAEVPASPDEVQVGGDRRLDSYEDNLRQRIMAKLKINNWDEVQDGGRITAAVDVFSDVHATRQQILDSVRRLSQRNRELLRQTLDGMTGEPMAGAAPDFFNDLKIAALQGSPGYEQRPEQPEEGPTGGLGGAEGLIKVPSAGELDAQWAGKAVLAGDERMLLGEILSRYADEHGVADAAVRNALTAETKGELLDRVRRLGEQERVGIAKILFRMYERYEMTTPDARRLAVGLKDAIMQRRY